MDFTLYSYKQLISTLQFQGYFCQTFEEYIQNSKHKVVILRHDVDRKPENALVIAKIERDAGIKASYYFRIVKESYDEDIIRQIAELGHEIGYHYENLAEIRKSKGVRSSFLTNSRKKGYKMHITL
jgi:3-dehydroquinate synthetase